MKFLRFLLIFVYLCGMFFNHKSHFGLLNAAIGLVGLIGLLGCASQGSPGGGLYDETPPVLRSAVPADGAVQVTKQKITLHFDENVKLDNVMEKMTVSPPQVKAPQVMSNAKTVTIELLDSLMPNTTYTIDLGDAVQDNNEGNPLEGLCFSFSTGDHIDSMKISGYLLNGEDLEPVTGAYVGIYKVRAQGDSLTAAADSLTRVQDSIIALYPDSIFALRPFERAGKSDALGHWTISGVSPGQYRLYALADGNTNYLYDLNSENVAFIDSLIVPSMSGEIVRDTIWGDTVYTHGQVDSVLIDSIIVTDRMVYRPSDLVLRSFNEGRVTRYLDDSSRPDSLHVNFRMAARMPEAPVLDVLNPLYFFDTMEPEARRAWTDSAFCLEANRTLDTLSYWIVDTMLIKLDTLKLAVTYLFTDTCGDVMRTDTIAFEKPVVKDEKSDKKDEKKDKKHRRKKGEDNEEAAKDSIPPTIFMTVKGLNQSIDIGRKPMFEVSAPLSSYDVSGFHLEQQKDSTWAPLAFDWVADTTHIRRYTLIAKPHYEPGASYRLRLDSASMHDIYGHPVDSCGISFSEKKRDDYSHLLFHITGIEGPAFVQLVDEKDKPIIQMPVKNSQAKFVNVNPGKCYARLTADSNGNGQWDAGNLWEHRQPEQVFYFNKLIEMRANWDYEYSWDVHEIPLVEQKPLEVKQNKPKEKAEKKSKNAEYYERMGITPPQTNTGTTTEANKNKSLRLVK